MVVAQEVNNIMVHTCRRHRNHQYTELYGWGLKVARKIYSTTFDTEFAYSPEDAVIEAILYLDERLKKREFDSENHVKYYFKLCIKSKMQSLRQSFSSKKYFSMNSNLFDSEVTFEDYIASKIFYPTLEEDELRIKLDNAMKCLTSQERDYIYQVWVQGKSICNAG